MALTAALAAAPLGACGSSRSMPPTGSARSVVITDPTVVASITVAVGDTIDFRMPPLTGEHRFNGQPVDWPPPYTSQSTVLRAQAASGCPSGYTCAAFKAVATGSAILYLPSPSGVICGGGHGCIGIAARAPRPVPVDVGTRGVPVVRYRQ